MHPPGLASEKATEGSERGEGNLRAAKPNGVLVSKVILECDRITRVQEEQLDSWGVLLQDLGQRSLLGHCRPPAPLPAPCSPAGLGLSWEVLSPHSWRHSLSLGSGV